MSLPRLVPLVGTSHLLCLAPPVPTPALPDPECSISAQTKREVAAAITIGFSCIFGLRPAESLSHRKFSPAIKRYATARLRAGGKAGPVHIDSLHFHDAPHSELLVQGTVSDSEQSWAYVATVGWSHYGLVLLSLRVL